MLLLLAIEQDVVWNIGLGSRAGNDMSSGWRSDNYRLASFDIDLEPRLLLSSGGCDMAKGLLLLALDWPRNHLMLDQLLRLMMLVVAPNSR